MAHTSVGRHGRYFSAALFVLSASLHLHSVCGSFMESSSCKLGTHPPQRSQSHSLCLYTLGEAEQLRTLPLLPITHRQTPQDEILAEVPDDGRRGWAGRKAHMLLRRCSCPHGHLTSAGSTFGTA